MIDRSSKRLRKVMPRNGIPRAIICLDVCTDSTAAMPICAFDESDSVRVASRVHELFVFCDDTIGLFRCVVIRHVEMHEYLWCEIAVHVKRARDLRRGNGHRPEHQTNNRNRFEPIRHCPTQRATVECRRQRNGARGFRLFPAHESTCRKRNEQERDHQTTDQSEDNG